MVLIWPKHDESVKILLTIEADRSAKIFWQTILADQLEHHFIVAPNNAWIVNVGGKRSAISYHLNAITQDSMGDFAIEAKDHDLWMRKGF